VHADSVIENTSKMKRILISFIVFYSFVIVLLANKNIKIEKAGKGHIVSTELSRFGCFILTFFNISFFS
jgi:hypothetical protein